MSETHHYRIKSRLPRLTEAHLHAIHERARELIDPDPRKRCETRGLNPELLALHTLDMRLWTHRIETIRANMSGREKKYSAFYET